MFRVPRRGRARSPSVRPRNFPSPTRRRLREAASRDASRPSSPPPPPRVVARSPPPPPGVTAWRGARPCLIRTTPGAPRATPSARRARGRTRPWSSRCTSSAASTLSRAPSMANACTCISVTNRLHASKRDWVARHVEVRRVGGGGRNRTLVVGERADQRRGRGLEGVGAVSARRGGGRLRDD